jgi:hypothetical protein
MTLFARILGSLLPRLAHLFAILLCILSLTLLLILGTANVLLARMAGKFAPMIEGELEQTLGRDVRIGQVQVDSFSNIILSDTAVAKGASFNDGTALTVPRALAQVNIFKLVWQGGKNPVEAIQQIVLQRPTVAVGRDSAGRFDFQDVVDRLRTRKTDGALQARIRVNDGRVAYRDARGFGVAPSVFTQQLFDVDGTLSPHRRTGYRFAVSGTDPQHRAGRVKLAGTYSPAEGRAQLQIRANRIDVKMLSDYLPMKLPITFEDGTAALRLSALLTNLPTQDALRRSPSTALIADVDLRGVGLRLDELTTPIVATSGRLRLTHDVRRYPQGSRLQLIDVRAQARDIPLELSGIISELNLLDLARMNPVFDVRVHLVTRDGEAISRLFPSNEWAHQITLDGPVTLDGRINGHPSDLRITGNLAITRFSVRGVQADGVNVDFALTPSAATPLQATATVRRLHTSAVSLEGLALDISSSTPWRQLEKTPVLAGTVRAGHARLPWLALDALQGQLTATKDGITISQMQTSIFGGQATGSVTFPFTLQDGIARAQADFTQVDLAELGRAFHLPDIAGHADGRMNLMLQPDGRATVETQVTSADAAYGLYEASHLEAALFIDSGRDGVQVMIPNAKVHTAYGNFTATDGVYRRGSEAAGAVTLTLHGEGIPLAQFGDDSQYGGTATLDGTLAGDPLAPTLTARVHATDGMLQGRTFAEGRGDMTYQADGKLRFRNVTLARAGMQVAMTGGDDGFDPRNGMVGEDATLTLDGAPLSQVLALIGQQLPVQVDGGTHGTIALHVGEHGITAAGEAFIPDATVYLPHGNDRYPLDLRKASLAFDYADRTLQVHSLRLQRGETTVVATGTAASPLGGALRADLTYHTEGAELADVPHEMIGLPVALGGAAEIHGTLHGAFSGQDTTPLTLTVAVSAPQLRAAGFPLGKGDAALRYSYRPSDEQLAFEHLTIENPAFTVRGAGRYLISRGEVDAIDVTVAPLNLAQVPALLAQVQGVEIALPDGLSGTGTLRLQASGPVTRPNLRAEVALRDGAYGGVEVPNLHAALVGAQHGTHYQVRLDDAVLADHDGVTLARADGIVLGDGAPNVRFSAQDITSELLAPWINPRLPLGGSADITGTLQGSWRSPVVETDVAITEPSLGDQALHRASGHLRLTRDSAALSKGELWFRADGPPMAIHGSVPLRWTALSPRVRLDRPFALAITLPRQNLSPLRALVPSLTELSGTVEGAVSFGGTLARPMLRDGSLQLAGHIGLPTTAAGNPNRLDDVHLRVRATGDQSGMTLDIERLSMTVDRLVNGSRVKGFQPGWLASEGDIRIPAAALGDPQRWTWDLYAKLLRVPVSAEMFLVPQASGYLHLGTADGIPEITGVLLVEGTKITKPKMATGSVPQWGPFQLNPQLNILVQVGDAVKMSSGMFSVPLRPTPLARPAMAAIVPGVQPSLAIDRTAPEYSASTDTLHAATAGELPGTWGALTGSLNDPAIFARFEVAKERLRFPLNLFSAVRKARGHVIYSRANGPQIVMGIPDFPTAPAGTPTASVTPRTIQP